MQPLQLQSIIGQNYCNDDQMRRNGSLVPRLYYDGTKEHVAGHEAILAVQLYSYI